MGEAGWKPSDPSFSDMLGFSDNVNELGGMARLGGMVQKISKTEAQLTLLGKNWV